MIDIYFLNKRLSISEASTDGYEIEVDSSCAILRSELFALFDYHRHVTLRCDDEALCYRSFVSHFTEITAAGGLVQREDGKYLMIKRSGRYDLPKGHLEVGESLEECAMREVEEETGVSDLSLGAKICDTLHSYYLYGRWEVKRTHWYVMRSSDITHATPQLEEGITAVEWFSRDELLENSRGSFQNIQCVVNRFLDM